MKRHLFFLVFMFVLQTVFSQNRLQQLNYDWDSKPNYNKPSEDLDVYGIREHQIVYFDYHENNLEEYYLEHQIIWVNSDEKIEEFNKVYLPYSNTSLLEVSKARVINAAGKIIELDKSKIFTSNDEETGRQYKYFALEGVEKGSYIEYLYVEKRQPSYNGVRFTLQSSYDKENVHFQLISPKNLIFALKSFNGLPEAVNDTLPSEQNRWSIYIDSISKLEEEDQSAYNAYLGHVIYKLDKNTANNGKNLTSYAQVSQNLYNHYYTEPDKKVSALVDKFLNKNNLVQKDDLNKTLSKLESYIKTNIFITKGKDADLSDIASVLNNNIANEQGIVHLYVTIFEYLGIEHEMVITCDRSQLKFDKDFESYNYLNDFLFYFKDTQKYMAPSIQENRYGYPPAKFTDNYGLFIKPVNIGNYKSAIGKIKYIEAVGADQTVDKMHIEVVFDQDDITKNTINLNRSFSGYYALYFHPFMDLMPQDTKDEILDQFAKSMGEHVTIKTKEIINGDPSLFGFKPIIFNYGIETDDFVEKAGRKYLFKLGDLIGQQIEMYQEKERKLPYENDFQRTYYRTITINVPKDYRIVNPEDILIDYTVENDGKVLFYFTSTYTYENDLLTITANEQYNENIISPDIFEGFRKVINGAADFNKIKLILEPK